MEKLLGGLLGELLGLLAILQVGKERFPFDLKWLISGFPRAMLRKIQGKWLDIRIFGLKMDVWSARNAQKNERKPSVTTVWWIVGPNGPQIGQKPD